MPIGSGLCIQYFPKCVKPVMFFNLLSSWRHHPHIWLSSHVRIFRSGQEPWPISQSPDLKTGSLCNHLHIDRQTRHVTINPLPQDYNKLKWMDRPFHRLTRLHSTKKKAALDRLVCACASFCMRVYFECPHLCVFMSAHILYVQTHWSLLCLRTLT